VTSSAPVADASAAVDEVPPSAPWRYFRWLAPRLAPLLAITGLVIIGISSTVSWGPQLAGSTQWALPDDLWGTLIAASRLLHGDLAGLYTRPTGLITLPGGAVILMPIVAVIKAAGISLQVQGPHNAYPTAWLLAGPYETAISGIALFAADAIAEYAAVTKGKRTLLAAAGAIALWNVSVRWGHPEDAVAVGLLLYAVLALARAKTATSAWLAGAAVAVQPLVCLALPILLAVIEPRRRAGFLAAAATPGVLLLSAAAAANWNATFTAVVKQPNWPAVDHPTPWLALATHLSNGAVAAGPVRLLAVAAACGCAVAAWHQRRAARPPDHWDPPTLLRLLWWLAAALALRSVFEPVMVAYYLWPVLAVALITATTSWSSLIRTSVAATVLTFGSQIPWRSPWAWWLPMMVLLALTLWCARVPGETANPRTFKPLGKGLPARRRAAH
jgi:hypothetical protein